MNTKNIKQTSPKQNTLTQGAYNGIVSEFAVEPSPNGEPESEKRHVRVETGIYRHIREGTYHERPKINGKRTWRSLGVNFTPQKNKKLASEEYHRRRTMESEGKNPYAEPESEKKFEQAKTAGDVIRKYQADGYLDRDLLERPDGTEADEERHCEALLLFWDAVGVAEVTDRICDDYRDWRVKRVKQGEGLRTVDRELNSLNNAFRYCKRRGFVRVNPVADRPKYQPRSRVKHCREFCPQTADELHESASVLFEHPNSIVLGFQMLGEAYSGLRTKEVLQWGDDHFGQLTPDGKFMNVWRCKNQHSVNPYVALNPGMQALLAAHKAWKEANYPDSLEFFPSHCGGSVDKGALAHALRRIRPKIKRKLTSHGMRAFYVLVRRSQGATDEQIAWELGHQSGGTCIKSTYGGVPENWRSGGGPNLSWLPTKVPLAWANLEKNKWNMSVGKKLEAFQAAA